MELLNAVSKFAENHRDKTDHIVVQEALEFSVLMLAPIVPIFAMLPGSDSETKAR